MERQGFSALVRLKNAIRKNQKVVCSEIQQLYSSYLPQSCVVVKNFNQVTQVRDTIAILLLPKDITGDFIPVKVTADGNCLYNAASVLVVGDESLTAILRLLTAAELYLHSDFYAHHPRWELSSI